MILLTFMVLFLVTLATEFTFLLSKRDGLNLRFFFAMTTRLFTYSPFSYITFGTLIKGNILVKFDRIRSLVSKNKKDIPVGTLYDNTVVDASDLQVLPRN